MAQHTYRHIEQVLALYYRELPGLERMITHCLQETERDLTRIEGEGPCPTVGVARYELRETQGINAISYPTERAAIASPDREEYDARTRALRNTAAYYREQLSNLAALQYSMSQVIALLDPDLREAIRKMYAEGLHQKDLPLPLASATVSYHVNDVYRCIDRWLSMTFYCLPVEFLREKYSYIFPGNSSPGRTRRRAELVYC